MKLKIYIEGMSCAACAASVERAAGKIAGVGEPQVNLMGKYMVCEVDETVSVQDVVNAINGLGFTASVDGGEQQKKKITVAEKKAKKHFPDEKIRLWVSVPLMLVLMYVAMAHMFSAPLPYFLNGAAAAGVNALAQLVLTLPILYVNRKFFYNGFGSLFRGSPNMDSLVAVSSVAALVYSLSQTFIIVYLLGFSNDLTVVMEYAHNLYYDGAAMILTLVTVGKMLEERSKRRTGNAIARLMDLSPKSAVCIRNGKEVTVNTEDIVVGDIIVIHPGERIPVDGEVLEGASGVDESAVTGESVPVEKYEGSKVIAGTVNGAGTFKMKAEKVGKDTTLAQIIELVENASASKAPIARLADRVAGVFVPVVMVIAAITLAAWLIADHSFVFALTNAIAVLVISCPCALGLATPVAVTIAAGKSAEKGILVKSAAVLETLHKVDTVILDKTGTITEGKPRVSNIYPNGISEDELLKIAVSLEKNSEHPLAEAIIKRAGEIDCYSVEDFKAVPGFGLTGIVNGVRVYGGNARYMESLKIDISSAPEAIGTPMYFANDARLLGTVFATDKIKDSSLSAVKRLMKDGVDVIVLTGDSERNAEAVKNELGISRAVGNVMPDGKADVVADIKRAGGCVAMVGDGINDSPALATADVGIAIGNGTDIAIDSADIVLTNSNLNDVPEAIAFSKRTMRIIKQNLFWAFIYNVLGIPVAAGILYPAFGITLSPMICAACMCLSSIFVNLNALRLYRK